MLDTKNMIPMTEANQNFSRVARQVDENGLAVILKNNRPRYAVVDFEEYEKMEASMQMRRELIGSAADRILEENLEAFLELAR